MSSYIKNRVETLKSEIERNKKSLAIALRTLRSTCKHLHLVNVEFHTPFRLCEDCGAQENDWYCGLCVLIGPDDWKDSPYKKDRVVRQVTFDEAMKIRSKYPGGVYRVGQDHPNFNKHDEKGRMMWKYKDLNKAYIPEL